MGFSKTCLDFFGASEEKPMSRASAKILGGSLGFSRETWGGCQGFWEGFFGNVVGCTPAMFLGKSEENQETARKSL